MKHILFIFPGLNDNVSNLEFLTRNWEKKYQIQVRVLRVGWSENYRLEERLIQFNDLIDKYLRNSYKVSLLGTSAGASLCINLYNKNKNISHIVNVCGRLKVGKNVHPILEKASKNSKLFKESVIQCEKSLSKFTTSDLKKILTVRALFPDLVVPSSTIYVKGGTNITIPLGLHVIAIQGALSIFSKNIIRFLKV